MRQPPLVQAGPGIDTAGPHLSHLFSKVLRDRVGLSFAAFYFGRTRGISVGR